MKKYYPSPARIKPNVLLNSTSIYVRPLWMDEDGTVYGAIGKELRKSSDLFRSSEVVHDFGEGFYIYNGMRMDNGEILIIVDNQSSIPRMLEWYILNENESPVTEVKQTEEALGRPSHRLHSMDSYGPIVLVSTYGNQAGTNQQRIFLSRDYGRTWRTIWDTPLGTNDEQQHVHSVYYDKYRNYIWAALGDHSNTTTMYSHDWGRTWHHIYKQTRNQFINVIPMPDRLICDTDISPDGVYMIPFDDSGSKPSPDVRKAKLSLNQHISDSSEFFNFAFRGIVDDSKYPWNVIVPFGGVEGNKIQAPVIMTYDGIHTFNIYEMSVRSEELDFVDGDFRFEYLIGVTPNDFTLDGEPYGNHAFGRGLVYDAGEWKYAYVDFEVPKWIAIE